MLTSPPLIEIRFVITFLVITIFNLANNIIQAQENTQSEVTNQVWIDFIPSYKISERFDLRAIGSSYVFTLILSFVLSD